MPRCALLPITYTTRVFSVELHACACFPLPILLLSWDCLLALYSVPRKSTFCKAPSPGLEQSEWHPGVVLLLWAPAKPTAKAGSSRAELAALAAQEYAAKFDELVCQAADGAPGVDPPLLLHSWRCFLARWVAALSAAAEENLSEQGQVLSCNKSTAVKICCMPPHHQRWPEVLHTEQSCT